MFEYAAQIVRVIDGDTVVAEIDLGFSIHITMPVRIAGINTPERGQDGWSEATDFTKGWCEVSPSVTLRTRKPRDKYGRYLAEIIAPSGDNLGARLIASGLASEYGS